MLLEKYVKVYDNILKLETLQNLIRFSKKINFKAAKVGDKGDVVKHIRDVTLYHLASEEKSNTGIHWYNLLSYIQLNYCNHYRTQTDIHENYPPITNVLQMDYLRYEKNSHYQFHADQMKSQNRFLSCIFLLNNDYEGGQLCFKDKITNVEKEVEVKPGRLVIWPSNFLFPHAVKPVTKGIRYSIVTWVN
jgi:Rps23 Pro-64 3,4-dihydroxylase Tpa1-like proline 4-hydroxylase